MLIKLNDWLNTEEKNIAYGIPVINCRNSEGNRKITELQVNSSIQFNICRKCISRNFIKYVNHFAYYSFS